MVFTTRLHGNCFVAIVGCRGRLTWPLLHYGSLLLLLFLVSVAVQTQLGLHDLLGVGVGASLALVALGNTQLTDRP